MRVQNSVTALGLLAVLGVLWACSSQGGGQQGEGQGGLPPKYSFLRDLPFAGDEAAVRARLPFRAIRLERQPCFGTCRVYTLELHRDGTARWNGKAHVERLGEHEGRIDVATFARLCYLFEKHGFQQLERRYSAPVTDLATTVTTVTLDSGEQVSVVNYGEFGPIELWGLEQMLDGVGAAITWSRAAGQGK